jgi:hypothetical protein
MLQIQKGRVNKIPTLREILVYSFFILSLLIWISILYNKRKSQENYRKRYCNHCTFYPGDKFVTDNSFEMIEIPSDSLFLGRCFKKYDG